MKTNIKKIIKGAVCTAGILGGLQVLWTAYCGYTWSWGPFAKLHDLKMIRHPGNAKKYNPDQVNTKEDSVLNGKNVIFLGSSVTYGASSCGVSFADYLEKQNGCKSVKEAVSGTTLVYEGKDSYIERLEKLKESKAELFICQLSTNDATQKKMMGDVSASTELKDFDIHTIAGAIEYIIVYAKQKWNCPVMFYTNPKYDSEEYEKMVRLLEEIQKKWGVGIIDMWNNEEFCNLSEEKRKLYMADSIHPTKAGYLKWWLPYMEDEIERSLE